MFLADFSDNLLYVELFSEASIKLLDANFDLITKRRQRIDPLEQVAAELLLRRL